MSMQPAQDGLFTKLFWIWIGLLISVLVFWSLRHLLLKGTSKNPHLPPETAPANATITR